MKKFNFSLNMFLIAVCSTLLIATCEKESDHLSVTPSYLDFLADDDQEMFVGVKTNVKSWNVLPSNSWIKVNKVSDGFYVTVDKYTATDSDRSGNITVDAGKADKATINLTQAAAQLNTLTVTPASISFAYNETGSKSVTVSTNAAEWDATMEEPSDWLTLEKTGNSLKFSVSSVNTGVSQRSVPVTVTAGTAEPLIVDVTQEGGMPHTLSVDPTSFYYATNETGTKSASVTTNAESWDAMPSADWITLSKDGNTLHVTVNTLTSSQRTAEITVSANEAQPVQLTVTQEASVTNSLSAHPTTIDYAEGETGVKTTSITTDADSWDATVDEEWVTLEKQTNTLSVNVNTLNTGAAQRSAIINVTAGNANPVNVSVTQEPTTSNFDPNKFPGAWQAVKYVDIYGTTTYPAGGTINILFTLNSDGTYVWDIQNSTPGSAKVEHRGAWTYSDADRMLKLSGTRYIDGSSTTSVNESFLIEELSDDLLVATQTTLSSRTTWTFQKLTGPSFNVLLDYENKNLHVSFF